MSSPEQLRQEYAQHCAAAGELQYRIIESQKALGRINQKIKELNEKFASLSKQAQAEAPAPEPVAVPEESSAPTPVEVQSGS